MQIIDFHIKFLLVAAAFLLTVIAMTAGGVCAGGPDIQTLTGTGKEAPPRSVPQPLFQAPGDESNDLVLAKKVFIREIRFAGNAGVSTEDLSAASVSFTGREVSFEELQELRQKLTLLYINRGFINSGVIMPDQKVRDGVVLFRVVEGRLTKTNIEGTGRLRDNYIEKRLEPYAGQPLNINDLQRGLQLLQQNPRIRSIHAELGPGLAPGDAALQVRVAEEKPFGLWFEGGNDYSPSIGSYGANLRFSHINVSGNGDTLSGVLGLAGENGLVDGELSYAIPLSARDTMLKFSLRRNETLVLEEPFRDLDIQSKNMTFGITLSHPLYKTAYQEFVLGLTGDYRKSRTFLLQRPFS
ncbi:MAG: hypothetical protein C0402_13810, partial [Thermodesulfovibrio sp.]|nr:hypothetical protein [Thermodesulfovibrio sp.]